MGLLGGLGRVRAPPLATAAARARSPSLPACVHPPRPPRPARYKSFCRESDATRAGVSQEAAFGACKFYSGDEAKCCKNFTDDGAIREDTTRPYASAVAGRTLSMRFHSLAKRLELVYELEPDLRLPTELRLPPRTYPFGFRLHVSPAGAAIALYDQSAPPHLVQLHAGPNATRGLRVNVTVVPEWLHPDFPSAALIDHPG